MKKLIATLLPLIAAGGLVIFNVLSYEPTDYIRVERYVVEEEDIQNTSTSTSPVAIYESMKPEIKATIIEKPEVVEESIVEQEESQYSLTDEEIDLLALVTMAEAEGECEEGQRLVIDTILNRVDSELRYFPDTVYDVVYQKNAFSSMHNGRVDRCYVKEEIRQLVIEELQERTNYEVMYFHAKKYGKYGTPMFAVGNHYFSSK